MASLINFSGIASGIDSSSLIKALLDRKRSAQVTPLQTKVTNLSETNDSLSRLKDLLGELNSTAYKFREVSGTLLSKLASSSDETNITASASNGAMNGSYSLNVTSLAKNATFSAKSSAGAYTSTAAEISAGTAFSDIVTVQVGPDSSPAETITVDVNETTTLSDFVNSFNAQSTKAVASLVNVGTTGNADYRIMINTNNTGTQEGSLKVTAGATLAARGAFDQNTLNDATNATFTISGVGDPIERQTNSIVDVIAGVTFNLRDTGAATITISNDTTSTTTAMQDFVDAYNKVIADIKEKDQITQEGEGDQKKMIFGPLASTSLDENILTNLRSALTQASITGQTVNTMADLGITTQRDGTLKLDTTAFEAALSSDPESVKTITRTLGETLAATDGTIAQYTRFNGLLDEGINANKEEISRSQARISDLEKALAQEEQQLTGRFSRLEALIGQLNSQQASLSQLLPRA